MVYGEVVASTQRRGTEEDRAGPQTEGESLRNDEDCAAVNEGNFDMAEYDDDVASSMVLDEQEEGCGEPKAQPKSQG